MVQTHTCWLASCSLGLLKQSNSYQHTLTYLQVVLEVPLCNLLTSMCDFVKRDRIVQRAYCFVQFFESNINSKVHTSILKPPIVLEQIRIAPETYKGKQVCLRLELLGCSLKYGELILLPFNSVRQKDGISSFCHLVTSHV